MAEYIEREALKQYLLSKGFYPAIVKGALESLPTADVVEVVRCKDCKYWDGEGRCEGIRNGLTLEYTDRLDYCSCGERKDGAE